MNNRMYKLMNWPEIEAIVYAESDCPGKVLGPHATGASTLYQVYVPGAKEVRLRINDEDKSIKMEQVDENGFFALIHAGKTPDNYVYIAEFEDESIIKIPDAYKYPITLDAKTAKAFASGELENAYEIMGAHPYEIKGDKGVLFRVWAPAARRASVVGAFNKWDGRVHQMNRVEGTGVFELFIPGIKTNEEYLFEINMRNGISKKTLDPYATSIIKKDNEYVCQIADCKDLSFDDSSFVQKRAGKGNGSKAVSIMECDLALIADKIQKDDKQVTYVDIAEEIIRIVKACGYTHVELKPIAEYDKDESNGYETIGFFAPTNRYGSAEDFASLINSLHKEKISVILDWTLAHPSSVWNGLRLFDGSGCYEHEDPRQGIMPEWGTLLFNYGRGEVVSFLKSNALYWIEKFHIDGLRIDSLAAILCLDYGRGDGQWIPNIYGGHENLEAVSFIKDLNDTIKQKYPGVITIAEDSSAWPRVTYPTSEDGLGFTYKWNIGWRDDYIRYSSLDPIFRSGSHNDLTFSMIYCYTDSFILPLPIDEVGDERLSMAYMMMHPGLKMTCGSRKLLAADANTEKYIKGLNEFYKSQPALYELDELEEGFEWINCLDSVRSTLSFIRKGKKDDDFIIVVANFAGIDQEINVGVTIPGKYTRVFNSDNFGSKSSTKEKPIYSIDGDYDARPYYIPVDVPALSLSVYSYTSFDESDREYMQKLEQEAKNKAEEAQAAAKKEESKAKAAQKKAAQEQKKAEEAARIAEEARKKAEEEYSKAQAELEKAREAMEKARIAAEKAELAAHRLEVTERSMKK